MATITPAPTSREAVYKTVYSPTFLSRFYDLYVLRFNMCYMWGCPTETILLPFFAENFSRTHLDIGVATGFLPAAALSRPFRQDSPHALTLLDISANSLVAAKTRVLSCTTATEVDCVEADVTEPLSKTLLAKAKEFESISMFNLFHCVPGGAETKLRALGTYKELLCDGGVLTGCTVLGEAHATGWLSRWYVRYFNRAGFFNNLGDTSEMFEQALRREFEEVETWLIGMVLLFRARKPRRGDDDSS